MVKRPHLGWFTHELLRSSRHKLPLPVFLSNFNPLPPPPDTVDRCYHAYPPSDPCAGSCVSRAQEARGQPPEHDRFPEAHDMIHGNENRCGEEMQRRSAARERGLLFCEGQQDDSGV